MKPALVDFLVRRLDQMIVAAKNRYRGTALLLKRGTRSCRKRERAMAASTRHDYSQVTVRAQSGLSQGYSQGSVRACKNCTF